MKKIPYLTTKVIAAFSSMAILAGSFYLIVMADRQSNAEKAKSELALSEEAARKNREAYLQGVAAIKKEYADEMTKAKSEYEDLLKKQTDLVLQHTRRVAVESGTSTASSSGSSTGQSTSSTKTVTVQKKVAVPQTKTTTKTS